MPDAIAFLSAKPVLNVSPLDPIIHTEVIRYGKTESSWEDAFLKGCKAPGLVKKTGERIVAQTEIGQLQEKRERIVAQLDEIDGEILALKKKRQAELMAELDELGLNVTTSPKPSADKKFTRQQDHSKPCKVCGETGHDARRHRSDAKKPVEALL